jgi:hypothetical protein
MVHERNTTLASRLKSPFIIMFSFMDFNLNYSLKNLGSMFDQRCFSVAIHLF